MSNNTSILINDSCVLFDLVDLNIIEEFFRLEYSFYTTIQVIEEIKDETQMSIIESYINNGKLVIDKTGSFDTIELIFDDNPGLSYADSSVFELARRLNGMLLTADKGLRNFAKKSQIDVKGFLWIIYSLVEKKILTTQEGIEVLKKYPDVNNRAPLKDIEKLLVILHKQEKNKI